MSPRLTASPPEPLVVNATIPMPAMQIKAARMFHLSGRRPAMSQYKKGTMTQYTAVRNAFLPEVVRSRPKVWKA